MAKGAFKISFENKKTELVIATNIADGVIPDDQLNLSIDITNTLATIKLLYKTESSQFSKAFDQLFWIAKTGLEGDEIGNVQVTLSVKALAQFKKEIVDRESSKKKNEYLIKLGVRALILGLPFLILGAYINYRACQNLHYCNCVQPNYLANIMILWSGTMCGVWLSFAITRTILGFDDLAIIEKDGLEPALRLIFTGILSIVFGLLFITNAIEIKLGSLSSHDISKDPITAFLIGTILGLNEKIIGNTLTKKTSALFNA